MHLILPLGSEGVPYHSPTVSVIYTEVQSFLRRRGSTRLHISTGPLPWGVVNRKTVESTIIKSSELQK